MKIYIAIAVGAVLGAFLRYFLGHTFNTPGSSSLFWGTLLANFLGCFLMGGLLFLALETELLPHVLVVGIGIGFLGSLTTFSTFSAESFELIRDRAYLLAGAHFLLQVLGSFVLLVLGYVLTRASLSFLR